MLCCITATSWPAQMQVSRGESLLPSHSSEACRDADSLGRPRGCLFLQLPSEEQGWGIWVHSVTCVPPGCAPSIKEAEAAVALQQDKALPTLQGHPGSCSSASAALHVQTA